MCLMISAIDLARAAETRERALSRGASQSWGLDPRRLHDEPADRLRSPYQIDHERIACSPEFRRLTDKTQVWFPPRDPLLTTRLTHTIEVSRVARAISRLAALNEDLTEAIAVGHDLGHAPGGHAGELGLAQVVPGGWRHNDQSVRIATVLSGGGAGLNLTTQVVDGIRSHSKTESAFSHDEAWGVAGTIEGQVVKLADAIAYLDHDFRDAVHLGLLDPATCPDSAMSRLGASAEDRTRMSVAITALAAHAAASSPGRGSLLTLDSDYQSAFDDLRLWMFESVYFAKSVVVVAERWQNGVTALFEHYAKHSDAIGGHARATDPAHIRAADFVSGLTDTEAQNLMTTIGLPADALISR